MNLDIDVIERLLGEDWFTYEEPETIQLLLQQRGVELSESDADFINAVKTLYVSTLPWIDPFVFSNVARGLNGHIVYPELIVKPEFEEAMETLKIMKQMKPDTDISEQVISFIEAIARHDNVSF